MGRYALGIGAAALLAACGGSQPPLGAPGAIAHSVGITHRTVAPSAYEMLYQFRAKSGAQPHARLINVNGTLYGTTSAADAYHGGLRGCGTVFALTP